MDVAVVPTVTLHWNPVERDVVSVAKCVVKDAVFVKESVAPTVSSLNIVQGNASILTTANVAGMRAGNLFVQNIRRVVAMVLVATPDQPAVRKAEAGLVHLLVIKTVISLVYHVILISIVV